MNHFPIPHSTPSARSLILLAVLALALFSCQQDEIFAEDHYSCQVSTNDNSAAHPQSATYQQILDGKVSQGLVGSVLLVRDASGTWQGASGYADLASGVPVNTCNPFLIASISKIFTGVATFALVDAGLLSIDDPASKWLSDEIVREVDNVEGSTIGHLLNHTSGIPDYYTTAYDLDRYNRRENGWLDEDILRYTYSLSATNEIGEVYSYSNTNYLLLGMIIEAASGLTLAEAYQQYIFQPLGLNSARYGTTQPLTDGLVKGYVDIHGNDEWFESGFLYGDEMGTGDGGIAINAWDLATFMIALGEGELLSPASTAQMQEWVPLPESDLGGYDGYSQGGYGLEYFDTAYGYAIGHTGGIDGFLSSAYYFPETGYCYVLLTNCGSLSERDLREEIYDATLAAMF